MLWDQSGKHLDVEEEMQRVNGFTGKVLYHAVPRNWVMLHGSDLLKQLAYPAHPLIVRGQVSLRSSSRLCSADWTQA